MGVLESVRVGAAKPADPALVAPTNVKETATGVQAEAPAPKSETPPPTERPAWLPEKFKTPEDFAASYKELESKIGAPKTETPPVAPTPEQLAAKGIDMAALTKEFNDNAGSLTEATIADLASKGITKDAVDAYVAGLSATAEKTMAAFESIAGGKEKLQNTLQWAKANLSAQEAAAFDSLVDSGNVEAVKLAFSAIQQKYTAATGTDPRLVTGERVPGATGPAPFESIAQLTAAMGDKRYATDPAYRTLVAKRLEVSNIL